MSLLFRPRCPSTWPAATAATAPLERLAEQLAGDLVAHADACSDIEFSASVTMADDAGYVEWVVSARHTSPLVIDDEAVIDPTGGRVTLRGVTVAEFSDGRICSFRHYWDELGLVQSLGMLPADRQTHH